MIKKTFHFDNIRLKVMPHNTRKKSPYDVMCTSLTLQEEAYLSDREVIVSISFKRTKNALHMINSLGVSPTLKSIVFCDITLPPTIKLYDGIVLTNSVVCGYSLVGEDTVYISFSCILSETPVEVLLDT